MKKFILAFFLTILTGTACYPQSFDLAGEDGLLINGAGVVQSGPSDTLQLITWLHLTNKAADTIRVMMKKEEIVMLPGASSSICWAGYCYGPEMTVSTFPLDMPPGDTVSGCFGHFGPNGCRGVSIIRWTFFNESDPNDSLSITVQYSTFPSATKNISDPDNYLSVAGPVPAHDQIVIRYSLPAGKSGRIELRNPSGKVVSVSGSVILAGTFTFSTPGLPSGIYYCSLKFDGNQVITRKIPVWN